MSAERYTVQTTGEGHYVFDTLDDTIIGEPFIHKFIAEIEVSRLNNTNTRARVEIYAELDRERLRQDAKWGPDQNHNSGVWLGILMEEVGEVATALLTHKDTEKNVEHELRQVAAVCVAWLEAIEKHR